MMQPGNRNTLLLTLLILMSVGNLFSSKGITEKVDAFIEEMRQHANDYSHIILMHGSRISLLEERIKELEDRVNGRKD